MSSSTNTSASNFRPPASSATIVGAQNFRVPASSANTTRNPAGNTVFSNTPAPQVSGQVLGASTGGSSGGGGINSGSFNNNQANQPSQSFQQNTSNEPAYDPEQELVNSLMGVYNQEAEGLKSLAPMYDDAYSKGKADVEGLITSAEGKGKEQKADTDFVFGDLLRQSVKSKQEDDLRRQGTYSSLGTLDSSSYAENTEKANQALIERQGLLDREKVKSYRSIDETVGSFVNKARSDLAQMAIKYQEGKNALANALATNNLNRAASIQSAIDQIRARAQQIQSTVTNFAAQVALLKAQGVDVSQGLAGLNGAKFAQDFSGFLQNANNASRNLYTLPSQVVPQGIGLVGKRKPEDQLL